MKEGTAWLRATPADTLAAPPLVLRGFRPVYAVFFAKAVHDSLEHLRPWMAWARSHVTDEAEETLLREAEARFDAGTDFGFLIFSADDEVVGACGVDPHAPGVRPGIVDKPTHSLNRGAEKNPGREAMMRRRSAGSRLPPDPSPASPSGTGRRDSCGSAGV